MLRRPPTPPLFPYTTLFRSVLEHRDAVDAHAEGPAGDLFRVVADVAQHLRVHHARAEDLEPAALLAEPAAGAVADEAQHIHFRSEEHTSELQSRENLVCRLL